MSLAPAVRPGAVSSKMPAVCTSSARGVGAAAAVPRPSAGRIVRRGPLAPPLGCRGTTGRRMGVLLREAVSTDELQSAVEDKERTPVKVEGKLEDSIDSESSPAADEPKAQDKTKAASASASASASTAVTDASANTEVPAATKVTPVPAVKKEKAVVAATASDNGNGVSASNNGNGAAAAATSNNSSNGNGAAPKVDPKAIKLSPPEETKVVKAVSTTLDEPKPLDTVEEIIETEFTMPDVSAGRLETAAATTSKEDAEAEAALKEAKTPYESPAGKWSKFKSYGVWRRTCMVWGFAIQFAFKYALLNAKFTYGKEGMTKQAVSARKKELAIWLREGLVKLGPTFIKIGQQFSTRIDVLAPEFVKELEQLQDNVPPFDSDLAIATVERNLGKKIEEVFDEFNPTPIAAASLGQVHLAKYKGETVVVKVQRPGLKELFDIDLKNIRALAKWLEKVDPKTDGAARDWVAIYDECSRILYEEIDYTKEGRNADRFRKNFEGTEWIKVPDVLWELTGPEVLVLEYVPGTKINNGEKIDEMGLDRKRLARLSVESYLQQLLTHGFFHADPHPGNVAVDAKNGGRLIYYDFGMMGSLGNNVRGGLSGLFYGVYDNDPDKCLEALIAMGVLVPTGDKTAVRRTAQYFLDSFKQRLNEQREQRAADKAAYESSFKEQRTKEESKTRRKQILAAIGEDLLQTGRDQPFRFPAAFTFVVRSFTVLDGIGKSLDPRFDISEISAPYARELLLEAKPQLARVLTQFKKANANQNRAVANLFKAPNAIERATDTLQRMERGELKVRVRALEAERALERATIRQNGLVAFVGACTLVNAFTTTVNAPGFAWHAAAAVAAQAGAPVVAEAAAEATTAVVAEAVRGGLSASGYWATAMAVGAGLMGVMSLLQFLKVKKLEEKELALIGA